MEELHNEADTRAKLIDPALHQRGWSEDTIKIVLQFLSTKKGPISDKSRR